MPKILAFAGSLRAESLNHKLLLAAATLEGVGDAEFTICRLRDYDLPVYDADYEAEHGLPEHAVQLKALFKSHDALLMACPEYNGSVTAAWKNAIDWVSRPAEGERRLECFENKVAALLAASPGGLGGLRGLAHVRTILSGVGVLVIPQQFALPKAHEAFDGEGRFRDPATAERALPVVRALIRVSGGLTGS